IVQDRIEQIMSWHEISNEEEFGEALSFAATLIPKDKVRIALVENGAPWIWNHLKKAFPSGKEILDYYHRSEKIHKLAKYQNP
ncbi:MAG: ISKra4 family transposase, partial [Bdellovibrionia bacterium]